MMCYYLNIHFQGQLVNHVTTCQRQVYVNVAVEYDNQLINFCPI